jgi:signal transduction histidine kinase
VERIADAASRAVDEARRALDALTRVADEPFPVVLQRAVDEMAERHDVRIVTSLDRRAEVDGPLSEALLRITGEAVRNAVRHGGAGHIDVVLDAEPLALTVSDDGQGFDPRSPRQGHGGGFGLTSMRERAEGVGAMLAVNSEPGGGTTVRVRWV